MILIERIVESKICNFIALSLMAFCIGGYFLTIGAGVLIVAYSIIKWLCVVALSVIM